MLLLSTFIVGVLSTSEKNVGDAINSKEGQRAMWAKRWAEKKKCLEEQGVAKKCESESDCGCEGVCMFMYEDFKELGKNCVHCEDYGTSEDCNAQTKLGCMWDEDVEGPTKCLSIPEKDEDATVVFETKVGCTEEDGCPMPDKTDKMEAMKLCKLNKCYKEGACLLYEGKYYTCEIDIGYFTEMSKCHNDNGIWCGEWQSDSEGGDKPKGKCVAEVEGLMPRCVGITDPEDCENMGKSPFSKDGICNWEEIVEEPKGKCVGEIGSMDERCGKNDNQVDCEKEGKSPFSDGVCDWKPPATGTCVGEIISMDERCAKNENKEDCEKDGKNAMSDGVCDWKEKEVDPVKKCMEDNNMNMDTDCKSNDDCKCGMVCGEGKCAMCADFILDACDKVGCKWVFKLGDKEDGMCIAPKKEPEEDLCAIIGKKSECNGMKDVCVWKKKKCMAKAGGGGDDGGKPTAKECKKIKKPKKEEDCTSKGCKYVEKMKKGKKKTSCKA